MDSKANGTEATPEASYTILRFNGSKLPDQYKALVFSKWLRSLRYGNEYFKLIDQEAYFAVYHKYIEMLLNKSETAVRLAVLSDNNDVVLGFSVMETNILHYVHVQADHRRQKIATVLCKYVSVTTHMTNDGLKVWASHPEVKFNPFEG